MKRRRILVTGASGQLAGAVIQAFRDTAEVIPCSRAELDIASHAAVMSRVGATAPDVIINCAAYNQVDRAEDEPAQALAVNAFAVRSLARAAEEARAVLVHYSTDFVFDGRASRPYSEEDRPNPQSVYAQSKLIGEWFALEAPRSYVLRVESLFGGAAARSSIDRIVESLRRDAPATVFGDRAVSPSYVVDVAAATQALIERGSPGLYHCVGTGHATWFEVGEEIARLLGKDPKAVLKTVSVDAVPLRAPRPKFAALANDKLRSVVSMPSWQDALRRYLA